MEKDLEKLFSCHSESTKPILKENTDSFTHIQKIEGSPVELMCSVEASPDTIITWYRNDEEQLSKGIVADSKSKIYKIESVHKDDEGVYSCETRNCKGKLKIIFNLRVQEAMIFDQKHLNIVRTNIGEIASLQCRVKSLIKPTIKWLRKIQISSDNFDRERNDISYIGSTNDFQLHEWEILTYGNGKINDRYTITSSSGSSSTERSRHLKQLSAYDENYDEYFYDDGSSLNRITNSYHHYSSAIKLHNVQESDEGIYACLAEISNSDYKYQLAYLDVDQKSKEQFQSEPKIVHRIQRGKKKIPKINVVHFRDMDEVVKLTETTQKPLISSLRRNPSLNYFWFVIPILIAIFAALAMLLYRYHRHQRNNRKRQNSTKRTCCCSKGSISLLCNIHSNRLDKQHHQQQQQQQQILEQSILNCNNSTGSSSLDSTENASNLFTAKKFYQIYNSQNNKNNDHNGNNKEMTFSHTLMTIPQASSYVGSGIGTIEQRSKRLMKNQMKTNYVAEPGTYFPVTTFNEVAKNRNNLSCDSISQKCFVRNFNFPNYHQNNPQCHPNPNMNNNNNNSDENPYTDNSNQTNTYTECCPSMLNHTMSMHTSITSPYLHNNKFNYNNNNNNNNINNNNNNTDNGGEQYYQEPDTMESLNRESVYDAEQPLIQNRMKEQQEFCGSSQGNQRKQISSMNVNEFTPFCLSQAEPLAII
ncbi:hypothetical protein SNEBB_010961 [Seison nebaliae]|nr:hypothetical protein SNEBB_010961 [Seison nebaliae]